MYRRMRSLCPESIITLKKKNPKMKRLSMCGETVGFRAEHGESMIVSSQQGFFRRHLARVLRLSVSLNKFL